MNDFQKTLEEHLRQVLSCPDLILQLRSDWGAKQPDFRKKLRHGIWKELASGLQKQDSACAHHNLHNLEELPSFEGHYISISHCQDFGGFVATKKGPVGFDIEIAKRVTTAAMERMASREEIQQAPSVASLWVAKEAAFKALRWASQPSTFSQIETTGWRQHPSLYESFTIKNPERFTSASGEFSKGMGVVITHEIYLFCIYLG